MENYRIAPSRRQLDHCARILVVCACLKNYKQERKVNQLLKLRDKLNQDEASQNSRIGMLWRHARLAYHSGLAKLCLLGIDLPRSGCVSTCVLAFYGR
jgi:hypothetical protein